MINKRAMKRRIAQTARAIKEMGLDVLFMPAGTNLYYYCGIEGGQCDRLVAFLISAKGETALVCPAFEADRLPKAHHVRIYTWEEDEDPHRLVAEIISAWGLNRGTIGMDERLWLVTYYRLKKVLPRVTFKDGSSVLTRARIRKSKEEIECLKTGGGMVRQALRFALKLMQPGSTEKEIAKAVVNRISDLGGRGWVMAQSGPTASLPHAPTGGRRFREGDMVVIDCGAVVEEYRSDVTRTFSVGKTSELKREIYRVVREAQAAAIAICRPGIKAQDVDRAARRVIQQAGYGKYFTHRTGHGIGLDGHEPPYLVNENKQLLEPGMTFTVEPGIYIPGELGVRLEDDILITRTGHKNLTPFPKEMDRI